MKSPTQAWNDTEHVAEETLEKANAVKENVNAYTEKAASKTPTMLFVAAALASIAVSLSLQLMGKKQWSLFVGHWAPSFLLFGLYNKISKTVGAD